MNYKMFIDDERDPVIHDCVICRSSKEAIEYMKINGCPSFISFDHDLGGDDTAMKVVNWMIEHSLDHPYWFNKDFNYYVHSQNPIGKVAIESKMDNFIHFMTYHD